MVSPSTLGRVGHLYLGSDGYGLTVHDPRPLPMVKTGPALLWPGRADASGGSELALIWPSAGPGTLITDPLGRAGALAPVKAA